LYDLDVAIQYFKILVMGGIVRLINTKRQHNVAAPRRRLARLGYAPAELRSLPEGLPVTIRRAGPDDEPAIAQLAEIDEALVPDGRLLVAEVGGELWAAVSVDRDEGISDPFRPSGELLRALTERAGRRHQSPVESRVRRSSGRPADTGPRHDGRSHPPVVRVRASADPAPEPDSGVGREQHDTAVRIERAEDEHLGDERTDLPGTEVDDGDDEPALERSPRVVDDLGRRAPGPELGAEVDRQLPGRLAGLGERVDGDYPADPHLDPGEVVELDHSRPNIAGKIAATEAPSSRGPVAAAWLAWLALATVYVVWGSTYLAIRVMVRTVPPLLGAGGRFLMAGLALYGWIWLRRGRERARVGSTARGRGTRPATRGPRMPRVSRREAAGAAVVGVLLTFGGNGLVTLAERHIASSLAALLIASTPLVIVVISATIGERVSRGSLVGVTVGFAGVTILVLPGASAGGSGLLGALLVLAAAVSWGVGSISSTRVSLPGDLGVSTALQMTFGGSVMLAAGLIAGEADRLDAAGFSRQSIVAFVYLVVFGSIVAFSAYTWLLQNVDISRVATYAYVNPMIAVLLGSIVLGESISPTTLVGASVIVGSVAFIVRSTRPGDTPERRGARDRPTVATVRRRV